MKKTSKILALALVAVMLLTSLMVIPASAAETTHKLDVTTLSATADKEVLAEGAFDDYFTISGKVTKRWSSSKGVYAVELEKKSGGAIEFTTTGKAKVTVSFSSTGGSNESTLVVVDGNGANVGDVASVVGTTATTVTYELATVGTYKVVCPSTERNTRVMSVEVVEEGSSAPAPQTQTNKFDVTTLSAAADKEAIEGAYDEYFTITGSATKRWSESKGVYAVEINKNSTGAIEFTTTGKAKVTVSFSSTGGSNESTLVVVDANGANVGEVASVVGTTATTVTYELATVGTYKVVAPSSARGTRVMSVEVVTEIPATGDCEHEGGTATCKDLAVCTKCGQSYGALLSHTGGTATCKDLAVCEVCGESYGKLADHKGGEATCVAKAVCEVCGESYGELGDHTLTFTTTIPTAELKGKTTAACVLCDYTFESGEVGIMTGGEYILDASALDGIGQYTLFDGEVKVVEGLFACHLSYKYRTDDGRENKDTYIDWDGATHRMNFGGTSELLNNGEGDSAVKNGGLKNFIQITTTGETTITIYWCAAGDGRQMGVYSFDGQLEVATNETSVKNGLYRSELTVPAGTWLIGGYVPEGASAGGNYVNRIVVDVHEHEWKDATCEEPKHCDCGAEEGEALGHKWTDATCTAPKTCSVCGETEGEALGHTWTDATCTTPKTCSACGATEGDGLGHDYDRGTCVECGGVDPEYTIWNRIIDAIMAFIQKILGFFKKA